TGEPFGRKRDVGGGRRRVRHVFEQPLQTNAPHIAASAGGEVLLLVGRSAVTRYGVEQGELDETVVGKVACSHWFSRAQGAAAACGRPGTDARAPWLRSTRAPGSPPRSIARRGGTA